MPTKQSVMDNAPANWRVTSNNGTVIVAVNIVTGEIFSGTHAEFNLKTQATPNSISTPADLVRHNDMHLGLGTPQTLWASGMLFWLPAGDGGANGLSFVSGGGNFTLSAAVVATFVTFGWVYLPTNAGGAGNPAGWYWFTMSDETHGKIYTTSYTSTSGIPPVVPLNPVEMAFTTSNRLTSTTTETQMFQFPFNFANQMGINGSIESLITMLGSATAGVKYCKVRAGVQQIHDISTSTSPMQEILFVATGAGSLQQQRVTRWSTSVGSGPSPSMNSNFRSINLSAESTLNYSLKTNAITEHLACVVRKVSSVYGG